MCGICGIFDYTGEAIDRQRLEKMTLTLSHRGPDDEGIYCEKNIGFGHRRLSIIDLTKNGHQPMADENKDFWIVYNGEVYNFLELKEQLRKKGCHFKSNTDTEVILLGYREWGEECWERLDGMFSFAIWDNTKKQLHLVRDPFGIKPLFYYTDGKRVIFGSELKAILASGLVKKDLNLKSLSNFLTFFYTPGPESIIQGIFHVEPGHALRFEANHTSKMKYWRLKRNPVISKLKENDLYAMIRNECRLAVKKSLVSDVPVGLYLSSGIDSNIILLELLALEYAHLQTFTAGFNQDSYDESRIVEKLSHSLNFRNRIVNNIDQDVPAIFDDMVYHLDSLCANIASLAEYFFFKHSAGQFKVGLVGSGNDELFAGYATYQADLLRDYYLLLPRFLRQGLAGLAKLIPPSGEKYSFDYLFRKFTEGTFFAKEKSHYWWRTIFTDTDKEKLFPDAGPDSPLRHDSFSVYEKYFREMEEQLDFQDRSLYADFFVFNTENSNLTFDNMSMAFSIEVRPPFLTKRFVDFAFSIPFTHKLRGKKTKYCLRKAYESQLPKNIVWKRKAGLVSPIYSMVNNQLKEMIRDNLSSLNRLGFFNKKYTEKLLQEQFSGKRDNAFKIYVLFTFIRWYELFINNKTCIKY